MARRRRLVAIGKRGGKIEKLSTVPGKPHRYLSQSEIILPEKPKPKVRVVWRPELAQKPPATQQPPVEEKEKAKPPVEGKAKPQAEEKRKRPVEEKARVEAKEKVRETAKPQIWKKLAGPMPTGLGDAIRKGREKLKEPVFTLPPPPPKGWPGTESEFHSLIEDMASASVAKYGYAFGVSADGTFLAAGGERDMSPDRELAAKKATYVLCTHQPSCMSKLMLDPGDFDPVYWNKAIVDVVTIDEKTGRIIGMRYDPHLDTEDGADLTYYVDGIYRAYRIAKGAEDHYPNIALHWFYDMLTLALSTKAFRLIGGDNILLGLYERFKEQLRPGTAEQQMQAVMSGNDWGLTFRDGRPYLWTSHVPSAERLRESGFAVIVQEGPK